KATLTPERDVEPRRIGVARPPATLALDHTPPEEHLTDDGADGIVQATAREIGRRLDRARGIETALTLGLRRRMRCGRRHPETVPFVTEGDRLAPRQPNGAVERRAKAQPILARDDEPAAPAHDWLGVVGRARSVPDL